RAVLAARPALGPRLLDAITERSIGLPRLAEVTTALRTAAAHHPGKLQTLLRFARGEQLAIPADIYSSGLHAATLCADAPALWPGGPQASAATRTATLTRLRADLPAAQTAPFPTSTAFGQGLLATCRAWPPTPVPPAPPANARIATPAILLAGDHDLSTPLEWARAQAARMPHARLVLVPGAGHSVLSREVGHTGRDALRRFLAAR
ncbi:MAG: hypothetical protein JWR63_4475, partial [Conexibacter sp.]|nr:hypothetical protein [Conexibacter sp.]